MGASVSCFGLRRGSDEEEDDDLALPGAKKDGEEDAMRGWRYNGGTLTDADAGPVEIVVSRLRTDASRSRVMDDGRDAPLTVTLYHKRASKHGEETAPRWVAAGKRDCLPDLAEKGNLVVNFRERALRELSKHKAPCFPLPSSFAADAPMQIVITRSPSAGDDVAAGLPARGGGRGGAKILGEVRFTLADLLKTNQRQLVREMSMTNVEGAFGGVPVRTGEARLCLAPFEITREWDRRGRVRPRTPAHVLSFETLLAMFKEEARAGMEKRQAPETSWTVEEREEREEREKRRQLARDQGGDSRVARTRRARTHARERYARGTDGETARTRRDETGGGG